MIALQKIVPTFDWVAPLLSAKRLWACLTMLGRYARSCLVLLLLCGPLPAVAVDWPYYQHDPQHTGRSTTIVDAAKLMPSWTAPDGYATPQIVGDTVYSTKSQGGFSGTRQDGTQWATYISAFDLRTGAIKWTHSGNYVFCSHAAVGDGLVAFYGGVKSSGSAPPTPGAQQLLVLDAATGTLRYKVSLPAEPNDSVGEIHMMPLLVPNPSDGTVMAYCNGLSTFWSVRLGPTSGSVVWKQQVGASEFGAQSMPTLVEDALVIGGTNRLFAFDRISGTPIFVDEDRRGGGAKTAVYDAARRHIYTPGIRGLSAFRYVNNAQIEFLWHRDGGGENGIGNSSITIAPDGKIYVPGSGFHFYELVQIPGLRCALFPAALAKV